MIRRARHLHENRLFECYVTDRTGEPVDPRVAEHLADCEVCGTRYSEIASFMDELSVQADAETNAVFTPERLLAQQRQIARHLEHVGRPARVISFPRPFATARMHPSASAHGPLRWLAAAAAAGFFIGVTLGVSFEWERHTRSDSNVMAVSAAGDASATGESIAQTVAPARAIPVATDGNTPAPDATANDAFAADDAFLSDLEVAIDRPHTRELLPFDALTPHVQQIQYVR